jgi:hypothetical protein
MVFYSKNNCDKKTYKFKKKSEKNFFRFKFNVWKGIPTVKLKSLAYYYSMRTGKTKFLNDYLRYNKWQSKKNTIFRKIIRMNEERMKYIYELAISLDDKEYFEFEEEIRDLKINVDKKEMFKIAKTAYSFEKYIKAIWYLRLKKQDIKTNDIDIFVMFESLKYPYNTRETDAALLYLKATPCEKCGIYYVGLDRKEKKRCNCK